MPPVTRLQTFPWRRANLCDVGQDASDHGDESMGDENSQICMEESSDLVAELVELTYEQQYLATQDPEVLYTIYNMWGSGLISAEHMQQFNAKFATGHTEEPLADNGELPKHLRLHDVQPTWSKADMIEMLRLLGIGYLTGMKKNHLWELLEPYQDRLLCFCPEAIKIVDRYKRYVEKRNAVESMIGCSIPQLVTYDMYMYKTVGPHTLGPIRNFNKCKRCVEAWHLLISLVRDPHRDVTFTACYKTFGLTIHHLKNITSYRQQPTMDMYTGTEISSATGAVAYRHHRYSSQRCKPIMRLYKLADVFKMLMEDHGSWGQLMEHLQSTSSGTCVPPIFKVGPFGRPGATLE